jgi:hypothetical protein
VYSLVEVETSGVLEEVGYTSVEVEQGVEDASIVLKLAE